MNTDTRRMTIIGITAAVLIGGSFTVNAIADSRPFQHLKLAASDTSAYTGFTHSASWSDGRRGEGRMGSRFANMSDEEIEKMVNRVVRHAAIEIDATDEQSQKITTIISAVAKDMKPLRQRFRATGKEMHDLLLQPTIDRAKMQQLRAQRFADADAMSTKMVDALADVAEVLTPEQRLKAEARIEEFRGKRRWFRGWHRG
ncbi:Spy/CpxP family protein refolding chaperone [Pseudahrensia aquimaris]|uniref:Spy/CpxP family protein refolding chaperone n=1 Tax=Pseudahrensia aquimaris TaxID=744461 RepID=A0ABW3FGA1_9HYPH